MPASPLRPGATRLLGYWGTVLNSVRQRFTTERLVGAIQGAREAERQRLFLERPPGGSIDAIDIGQVRSLAVGYRNAMEQFTAARPEQSITAAMLGSVPWSRPLGEQAITPLRVEVRAQYDVVIGQFVEARWITHTYEGNLPGSVGDVRADIEDAATTSGSPPLGELVAVNEIWLAKV